ncbi:hypothetical protein GCM10009092_28730 [Bowmanella denitrificans]|uniref:Alginate export domain-containing protein n=1 Tax=Bowmanella denitrificans TaxID=366582 RepID=A0ABN0XF32_9ALTE
MLQSVLVAQAGQAEGLQSKVASQIRLDDRSGKDLRYQYRLRIYPSFNVNDAWSLHAFVATGNAFASSHNTLDEGKADHLYMRRFFIRHQDSQGKTELGVIPTYKGDVASTGLSKDGWISGIRHVQQVSPDSQLELVAGELAHIDDANAWQKLHSLNYLELEFTSQINSSIGYELSLEHMLGDNFFRGELRYQNTRAQYFAIELIDRLDSSRIKMVLSMGMPLAWLGAEFFTHYSYVDKGFGQRAELTEDFLEYGHALAFELDGKLNSSGLGWFAKAEHYADTDTSRIQIGLSYTFASQ